MCLNYSEVGSLALVTVTVTVPVPVSVSVAITIGLVSLTDSVGTRKVIIRAFGRIRHVNAYTGVKFTLRRRLPLEPGISQSIQKMLPKLMLTI